MIKVAQSVSLNILLLFIGLGTLYLAAWAAVEHTYPGYTSAFREMNATAQQVGLAAFGGRAQKSPMELSHEEKEKMYFATRAWYTKFIPADPTNTDDLLLGFFIPIAQFGILAIFLTGVAAGFFRKFLFIPVFTGILGAGLWFLFSLLQKNDPAISTHLSMIVVMVLTYAAVGLFGALLSAKSVELIRSG